MGMKEDSQNYIYIHTDTSTEELTFVVKGDSEVVVDSLIQVFEDDKALLSIVRRALFLFEYGATPNDPTHLN
jgi:hypothetical protein